MVILFCALIPVAARAVCRSEICPLPPRTPFDPNLHQFVFLSLKNNSCTVLYKPMVLKLCVGDALVRRFNFPRASDISKLSAVLFNELT